MRKLSEVIADIKEATDLSNTHMDDVPLHLRPGTGMRIAAAVESLARLDKELQDLLPTVLVGVFATGKTDEVSDFIKSSSGVVVNAADVWEAIAGAVEHVMYEAREYDLLQHSRTVHYYRQYIEEVFGVDKPVAATATPEFIPAVCPTRDSLVAHIRTVLRAGGADILNIANIKSYISAEVSKNRLDGTKIPVLVLGASDEEKPVLGKLFCKSTSYHFEDDFKATQESLVGVFRTAV